MSHGKRRKQRITSDSNVVISAIVFDAFGTLMRISRRTNPYRELVREGRRQGVVLKPDSLHVAITANVSQDGIALTLGVALTPSRREELYRRLKDELSSIEAYVDAVEAISPGHYFSDTLGRVLMIGDSVRCDRDGPRDVGVIGFHLDRSGRGKIQDLVQFARMVIDRNSSQEA